MSILELPDIVQSLQNKQWTGTLQILSGGERSTHLYFRGGMIQHCSPDKNPMPLGKALNKLGLIDEADYVMTMVDYEQTGRKCGEVLVELGLVDKAGILEALSHQAREHVLEVFEWKNVDVKFDAGEGKLESQFTPQQREVQLNLAGMSLLMEAARRSDEWSVVREAIPNQYDVLAPANPEGLSEGLIDRRVVLLIDSYRSATEIAETSPAPTLEILKELAELVKQGHLKCLAPAELAQVGVLAESDSDFEKALRVFELAVERGLDHIDLHKKVARSYNALGKSAQALTCWLQVAERCSSVDRKDLALDALKEAAELDPDNLELGQRLVNLLLPAGETEEAASRLRRMIDLAQGEGADVSNADVLKLMDQFLELQPADTEILERCSAVHLAEEDKLYAMVRLDEKAAVLNSEGKLDEAVEVYYRVLDIDPENLEARLLLSQNLAKLGSTDDAVREYRRLADILFKSGVIGNTINWPFLIKVYEAIVELEPASTPAWEWLAKAYIENDQLDLAISRYIGMADSLQPTDGEPTPIELLQPLRSVVEIAPERLDIRHRLASTHLALNQIGHAVRSLRDLAEQALNTEQVPEAIEAYKEALDHQPFDMDSRRGLAAIYEEKGQFEEAFAIWRAVGGMCFRAGLLEQACKDYHRAFQLRDDDMETIRELAEIEAARGRARNSAMLFARYAQLQINEGNHGIAREAIERAGRLEPNLPQVAQITSRLGATQ